jgi:steroid 5-alpha reductase family enzyme
MIGLWTTALAALLAFAIGGWVVSLFKRDVSIVDGMWPLMFLVAALCYVGFSAELTTRAYIILLLVFIWSVRLSAHIFVRNHGADEDYRYQQIRDRNSPYFQFKSLYIVFGLQAVLAWIISLPLLAASVTGRPLGLLDLLGAALWLTGFLFESIGDYQLARFRASPASKGKVLDTGLWRFTRHPNYFGDFCVWWGFYLVALSTGLWWSIISPLLMSLLLLKVSGVSLLEKDIGERRPKYAEYAARTNAFFPGPRKRLATDARSEPGT